MLLKLQSFPMIAPKENVADNNEINLKHLYFKSKKLQDGDTEEELEEGKKLQDGDTEEELEEGKKLQDGDTEEEEELEEDDDEEGEEVRGR